jgi:hypothetical protein
MLHGAGVKAVTAKTAWQKNIGRKTLCSKERGGISGKDYD